MNGANEVVSAGAGDRRVLIVVPTFNERDNLPLILDRIRSAAPTASVLVVDDSSPDGTGFVADVLADADSMIDVMHRQAKDGLGPAYFAGFRWGIDQGFDVLVQMDADGSHAPEQLDRLLEGLHTADVVIGSRYVPGGSVVNWPRSREILSRGGNLYARLALGVHIHDITAGYRAYRASVIDSIPLNHVSSRGYCFQVDLAWRAIRLGVRVVEVPITFTERQLGESKMSGKIVREALTKITAWGLRHRWEQARRRVKPQVAPNSVGSLKSNA